QGLAHRHRAWLPSATIPDPFTRNHRFRNTSNSLNMTLPHCFIGMTAAVLAWTCLAASTAYGQAVEITDPKVEAAIRAEIGKASGDLTAADLLKVVELDLRSQQMSTVTIPEGLTNLEVLDLSLNLLQNSIFSPMTIPTDLTSLHTL